MKRYLTPVKREFWEYKGSFVYLPAAAAVCIALLMLGALTLYASGVLNIVHDGHAIHLQNDKGQVRWDIDFDEDDQEVQVLVREQLLQAREELIAARDNIHQQVDTEEIARAMEEAQAEIARAQQELDQQGIAIKLDKMVPPVDVAKIHDQARAQLDREIAKLDRQLARLDRQADLMPAPPEAPAVPEPFPAPEAPAAPDAPDLEIRQFPSQVIVIENHDTKNEFLSQNLEEINNVFRVFYALFSGLMIIVAIFYLISALYTDRKDNSILFWKSMPVTETQQVLTKLAVALLALPTIAVAAALLVNLVFTVLAMIFAASYSASTSAWAIWSGANLISLAFEHWFVALGVSLWSLPFFAWLILASAGAKRSPFMLASLPPLAVVIFEEVVFDSNWLLSVIASRIPALRIQEDAAGFLDFEKSGLAEFGNLMASPGLWLGLLVAAAMVYAAIWLRNNRYEI